MVDTSAHYTILSQDGDSSEKHSFESGESLISHKLHPKRNRISWFSCLIHLVVLITYTSIFLVASFYHFHQRQELNPDELHPTPLRDALHAKVTNVDYDFNNTNAFKNSGPIDAIDAQWLSILNSAHDVRLSKSEVERTGIKTIQLADGSGDYLVQPIVYHMLHCLYNVYRYNHLDHYGEDPSGPAWRQEHTDHCIDNLRQFVMCHGGGGVSTFHWLPSRRIPWPQITDDEVCIDWDRFHGWVNQHSVNMDDIKNLKDGGLLVHPDLGPLTNEDYGIVSDGGHGKEHGH